MIVLHFPKHSWQRWVLSLLATSLILDRSRRNKTTIKSFSKIFCFFELEWQWWWQKDWDAVGSDLQCQKVANILHALNILLVSLLILNFFFHSFSTCSLLLPDFSSAWLLFPNLVNRGILLTRLAVHSSSAIPIINAWISTSTGKRSKLRKSQSLESFSTRPLLWFDCAHFPLSRLSLHVSIQVLLRYYQIFRVSVVSSYPSIYPSSF